MSPTITKMEVWPVAGQDCMELNLSGAHAPYFTRNVVVPVSYTHLFLYHGSCITIPVSQSLCHNPPPAIKLTELR